MFMSLSLAPRLGAAVLSCALFAIPMQRVQAADAASASAGASQPPAPESREISFRHVWTKETLTVVYKVNGEYQVEAMQRINHLMRDYRCEKTAEMDPKLIDLIWELTQTLQMTTPVGVVSAYRSEGYNASLLRAGRTVDPHSNHMYGKAVDVIFPGVSLTALRDAAAAKGVGGVGHYPFSGPAFVHVDTGPVRQWEEMHPAQRRAMRLPMRIRTRLRVNCDLKMEDVLKTVPEADVIAALPEGASTELSPRLPEAEISSAASVPLVPAPPLAIPERIATPAVPRRRIVKVAADRQSVLAIKRIARKTRQKPCRGKRCETGDETPRKAKGRAARRTAARRARVTRQKSEPEPKARQTVRKLAKTRAKVKSRR
jgi:uncharacterized protein YcbK (DUF882 family)